MLKTSIRPWYRPHSLGPTFHRLPGANESDDAWSRWTSPTSSEASIGSCLRIELFPEGPADSSVPGAQLDGLRVIRPSAALTLKSNRQHPSGVNSSQTYDRLANINLGPESMAQVLCLDTEPETIEAIKTAKHKVHAGDRYERQTAPTPPQVIMHNNHLAGSSLSCHRGPSYGTAISF